MAIKVCKKQITCPYCGKIELCAAVHFGKHRNSSMCDNCVKLFFQYRDEAIQTGKSVDEGSAIAKHRLSVNIKQKGEKR